MDIGPTKVIVKNNGLCDATTGKLIKDGFVTEVLANGSRPPDWAERPGADLLKGDHP